MKTLAALFAAFVLSLSFTQAHALMPFPKKPDASLTPGDLCRQADQIRYPERIKYCERNVDLETKKWVIQEYDRKFGYEIDRMDRQNFKIDHYFPLCAGGSNHISNLWPQHESVYVITDILEAKICEKMAEGRLRQLEALQIVKIGKSDLNQVSKLLRQLEAL